MTHQLEIVKLEFTALIIVLLAVYTEANKKDNENFVYRELCIGLEYEQMDAVMLIKELEKVRGKLNLLDVNVETVKNMFETIMGKIRMRAKENLMKQLMPQDFRGITDGRKLKYCLGYYGEVPIPREILKKIEEAYAENQQSKNIYTFSFRGREQSGDGPRFSLSFTDRVLDNLGRNQRRWADEHWVEIGNGVHKTELKDAPPEHLKHRLLHLLELKQKRQNGW